jgi:hypothetical protein
MSCCHMSEKVDRDSIDRLTDENLDTRFDGGATVADKETTAVNDESTTADEIPTQHLMKMLRRLMEVSMPRLMSML